MRRALALIALVAAACGGSPAAPRPPGTSSLTPPDLRPGAFLLTFSHGRAPQGGGETPVVSMLCVSQSLGPLTIPESASVHVVLEQAANGVRVFWEGTAIDRTLSGTLQVSADGSVIGTMGGRASAQNGVGVLVAGKAGQFSDARVTGTAAGRMAQGDLEGHVEFFVGQGSGSCTPMMWTLVPR